MLFGKGALQPPISRRSDPATTRHNYVPSDCGACQPRHPPPSPPTLHRTPQSRHAAAHRTATAHVAARTQSHRRLSRRASPWANKLVASRFDPMRVIVAAQVQPS